MKKENFKPLAVAGRAILTNLFGSLRDRAGWGNGRDVNAVWQRVCAFRADRIAEQPGTAARQPKCFHELDINKARDEFLLSRPDANKHGVRDHSENQGETACVADAVPR